MSAELDALADGVSAREDLQRALKQTQRSLVQAKAKTAQLVEAVYSAAKAAALTYPVAAPINVPKRAKPGVGAGSTPRTGWQS